MNPNRGKELLKKTVALAMALGTSALLSTASAEEAPVFDLDQIVVSATKTEKKIREVPVAVEVITKEEMDKKNIKRVDDALKSIPGVYVRQSKGIVAGSSSDSITMRGFGKQKQVLILVDGQPVNDGYNGGVGLANIPTENIERIEVIKGPASALYGSNAMGGVINIITTDKAKQETIIRLGSGELGTNSQSLYTSGSAGTIDYFITAQRTSVDGYVTNPTAPQQGDNGMKRELFDGKLVFHLDDNSKLSLAGGNNKYKYFSNGIADRGEANEDSVTVNYENKLNNTSSLKVSYGAKKLDYWYVSGTGYTQNPSKTAQAELQYNFMLGEKDSLTVGYARRTEEADSIAKTLTNAWDIASIKITATTDMNIGGKTETNSFYLQDEHKLSDRTVLYIGGRYDDWKFHDAYTYGYNTANSTYETTSTPESSANSFNPKVGIVRKMNDKLTFRSSIGTAFRSPNVYELAKDWTNTSGSTTTIYKSNSALKPEKSTNYELGFDYQPDNTMVAKFGIFHNDVTDAIDQKSTKINATTTEKVYINSDKARINGLEIGVTKRLSDAWNSFVNYTYTDAKVVSSAIAPANVGKQLAYVPKQMVNMGVNYAQGRWQGNLTGNYVSETNSPDKQGKSGYGTYEAHFTVDTKVTYQMTKDTAISLSVDNMFDRQYYTYYLSSPRTTYLELVHKF